MWQAPNQRVRAIASAKKRERDRFKRPFHIKRVHAELKAIGELNSPPSIAQARLLLNDLSPKGMGLFSSTSLLVGQEVAITIEHPKRFYIRGRIVWCQEHDANSHVLSETPYSYRMGVEFLFETQEEEQRVQAFVEEINEEHLYGEEAA